MGKEVDFVMEKNQYEELAKIIDRGIDDMENNRELPIDEAFDLVDELIRRRNLERA